MKILITGGAGYIGSHVVKQLLETTSHSITVLDNLSTGYIKTIQILKTIRDFEFVELDLKEFDAVNSLFQAKSYDAIIHFAACSLVAESVENPLKYYMNNTVNTTNLIKCANEYGVKKFIFSSTAAVYGEPKKCENIDETTPTNPINPYGTSKLMSEKVLQDTAQLNSTLKYIIFRYFNVSGSDMFYIDEELMPRIGECHEPETHLMPLVAKTALKKRTSININGEDFNTPDGSCIRDYIHVEDLANAHIQAIKYLDTHESDIFNLGYGKGYSVKEVINAMKNATKSEFQVIQSPKREGDPAFLVANNTKILEKMHWKPKYNNLELICQSSYMWEKINE